MLPFSSVPEAFSAAVNEHGSRLAVVDADRQLSYNELEALTNRFARRLIALGLLPGEIVATFTHRSLEAIVTWLAILKCGAAYLPIDPGMPAAMISDIIQEAAPRLILSERGLSASILRENARTLDDELAKAISESDGTINRASTGETLAYVMYTSGSTGQPKGVLIAHRAILRLVIEPNYISLSSETVMLQLAPLAFDASTFEIWGTLLNGGQLVVFPDAVPSLADIGRALAEKGINTLWLTAGLFHLMVEERLPDMIGLTQLMAGGDVLSTSHLRRAMAALPDCAIINGYGPTENTTFTCCYRVPRDGWGEGPVPIGYPISNTRVHILDEMLRPVAPGAKGQLCAGGDGVAVGYLGRPDLTAQRFVTDPFSSDRAARIYLTGDIVFEREDGAIEFCGRQDRQVKISGFRIELDAIEIALRGCSALSDAAIVLAVEEESLKRIVAFLKPATFGDTETIVAAAKRTLTQRLPAYMMPHVMEVVSAFPLNANGKVDRGALLHNFTERSNRAVSRPVHPDIFGELGGHLGEITRIWQDILGRIDLDPNKNLFDLGATSLMIVQAHDRIQTSLGRQFAVTEMFASPTISALVARLGTHRPVHIDENAQLRARRQRAILIKSQQKRH